MEGNIARITEHSSYTPAFSSSKTTESRSEGSVSVPRDTFEKKGPLEGNDSLERKKHKSGKEDNKIKEYTILAYEAAACNLEEYMVNDVKEMESRPQSDNCNVVVQLSRYHISPLTASFFAEALSQAFKSREFKGVLQETVKDSELLEKYGELLRDHSVCSRISTILLRKNPALQERLDKLVQGKVKEASKENKDLSAVLQDTMTEILSQIDTKESEREEEATVKTLGAGLLDIFEDEHKPLANVIARTAGKFINGIEGTSPDGPSVLSDTGLAGALGGRRGDILFAEPAGDTRGSAKFKQGDYEKYLDWVDEMEVNNEPLWRGVKRYELGSDDDPTRINSKPAAFLGYADMSKPETLANFIIWGMNKYPARHFIVLLSDHGAGFLGAEEDRGNMLSLPDLREALEIARKKTGKTPDILAFDCCLMAQTEVAYELKDAAKYLVASEEIIGGDGYPYKELLPAIDKAISEGKSDPGQIAGVFIDEGRHANEESTYTLSAIDLSQVEGIVKAADQLASHILEGKVSMEDVRASLKQTQHFNMNSDPMDPYDDFRDLGDLVDKLDKNPNITNEEIKQDLRDLREALEKGIIREQHQDDEDYEGTTGISIYAPRRKKSMSIKLMGEYEKTMMGKSSKWTELIKKATDYEELVREAEEENKKDGGKLPRLTFIPLPRRPL